MNTPENSDGKNSRVSSKIILENKSPQLRPNSLNIATNNLNSPISNTSFLLKEIFSPSNSLFTNLGNVILASPNLLTADFLSQIDGLSPRTILTTNNLTNEQLQVDKKFNEKYKEIKAQNLKEEKVFPQTCNESTILFVSQNTLDQLNGAFSLSSQPQNILKSAIDDSNIVSLSTSTISNTCHDQQYIPNAPSSASSVEIPTSSNCSENDKLKIKIDKKRARNRDAARKCRERKLQLMKKLEKEVHILTQQKSDLENKAQSQKKQIENLKAIIVQHLKSGCKM